MLEDSKLISLKEAAKLSGYSADYIGQLIRAGKLPGKQVYCNVAWMTTAEAIEAYQNKDKKQSGQRLITLKNKINFELEILRLFFRTFKSARIVLTTLVVSFVLFTLILLYQAVRPAVDSSRSESSSQESTLSF